MKKFICLVCGYIYEGDLPPEVCPICNAGKEMFEEVTENNEKDSIFKTFTVEKKIKENDVVTSFYLRPAQNIQLKEHKAGQFVSIKVKIKGREEDDIRQYSLSMKPGGDFYRISVKREEKGLVSRYLHDKVFQGGIVEITDPLGEFILKGSNKPLVLMSGGIGITPVMSMLYEAANSGREIIFVQAVLNSSAHTFKKELRELAKVYKNIKTAVFYAEPLEEDKLGEDYDHLGFVSKEWILESLPKDGEFYFCGPLGFMKHLYNSLTSIGIDKSAINYEMFGPTMDLGNC